MEMSVDLVLQTAVIGLCLAVVALLLNRLRSTKEENVQSKSEQQQQQPPQQQQAKPTAGKKKQEKWSARESKQSYAHPWMLTSLKGHSGEVLDMDFSGNSKFLATCSDDRTVLLWSAKHLDQKEHKNLRVNVEFDHGTLVRWSPDSKAFIIFKAVEAAVEVYKVNKKADGWIGTVSKAITFPKAHVEDAVGMDIAANGRFIMTCSEKTDLVLWDLRGERLATLDTLTVQTHCAKVSPCGNFVAASGFTPDVKVWEVLFSKSGDFDKVARAFELKGHKAAVLDLAFSADSSRAATISKDGSWRVFDIKIEYRKGEDPHLLKTGTHPTALASKTRLALSPDGESFAVASGSDLSLYVVQSGKLTATIKDIYTGPIRQVRFDPTGSLVLTAGDRHVRVFHNVAHYAATVEVNGAKLKQTGLSAATKERLSELVASAKKFLADNNVE
ncbi:hypothetical protein ONE63_005434 [Megalurothrips usitatus]|uniref:Transducin beta-like protein 2 n=1 Tax=Megalurothrips usitatus TaxID=439358 RepID=A0AAV7XZC2_9NEOP|nr:hypothetical protein ONE63_005434 [Megalurothrips usitatus]